MKKVLIFSLAYFPKHVGGAEVAIKEITDRLPDIEFHLIANRYDSTLPKIEKIGNVLVHRIGISKPNPTMNDLRKWPLHLNKFLYQFVAFWKAYTLHQRYAYDVTWAMMAHSCGVPAVLFKFAIPHVPYILTLQEGDPPGQIEKTMLPLWPLFASSFKKADVITVISTFLGEWAKRRGFKGEPELIPNAANIVHFSRVYPDTELNVIRDSLEKKPGDIFLITTSRLVYKNAIDDVIRALPSLPENVHFIVCGIGPDEKELKKLALVLHVQHRVHFLGQLSHEEMPKYLHASDIFIRASRSEGMGSSFIEAMAAELPIIATQEGGIADFLFDEKRNPDKPTTGWAVDTDSPADIAEAVKDIMNRPERVRSVVATAKKMVQEKYDWDIIANDMRTKVFERLFKN